jgi:hypothetical protein
MPRQYAHGGASGGQNAFSQEQSLDFWAVNWRREYLAPQPPPKLDETLERARQIAAERPKSYLAKNFKRLYGGE